MLRCLLRINLVNVDFGCRPNKPLGWDECGGCSGESGRCIFRESIPPWMRMRMRLGKRRRKGNCNSDAAAKGTVFGNGRSRSEFQQTTTTTFDANLAAAAKQSKVNSHCKLHCEANGAVNRLEIARRRRLKAASLSHQCLSCSLQSSHRVQFSSSTLD